MAAKRNSNKEDQNDQNGIIPSAPQFLGDRLPPYNIEAEQCTLGSILLNNETMHDVIPLLKVDDFYRDSHQIIYKIVRELYDKSKPVDVIILVDELVRRGEFEKIGGDETLRTILEAPPHAANAVFYAQIVKQKAVARELIEASDLISNDAYAGKHNSDQLLEEAERRIFKIAEEQSVGETVELSKVIIDAMDRIAARAEQQHAVSGLSTGYFDLDALTAGFQETQLIILAARPSMGKTALALNICEHVICELKQGVLFVSLEMGEMELVDRLLSSRARIDGYKLRTGKGLGPQEMTKLGQAYGELHDLPLFIDSTPARNMLQITANARRLKLRKGLGLIVVDYIQLVDSEESRDSRQEQIAKISRRLKQLARELKIPVIALSQLNRAVENREDRRPRMADLRESGAIEQDADLVLLLHRPEYYDANDQPGIAELIIAKNRAGATDTVKLQFTKNLTRFENLSQAHEAGGGIF